MLLANGAAGLFVFLAAFFGFVREWRRAAPGRAPGFLVLCFFALWFLNAFFNGVYTYVCAVISLPFYFDAMFGTFSPEEKCTKEFLARPYTFGVR